MKLNERIVFRAVMDGAETTTDIIRLTGLSRSHVDRLLISLAICDHVFLVDGRYSVDSELVS